MLRYVMSVCESVRMGKWERKEGSNQEDPLQRWRVGLVAGQQPNERMSRIVCCRQWRQEGYCLGCCLC